MAPSSSDLVVPDFRTFFDSGPGQSVALTPDFRIAAISDAHLKATMTQRDEVLGRNVFDVWPDNPNDPAATGVANLRASLTKVLKNKAPDTMAVQKYAIRRPESQGGGFEERAWRIVNSPIFNSNHDVTYIINHAEDITEQGRLTPSGSAQQQALGESEERYRLLVEGVKDYAIFMLDKEGRVLTWNDGAQRATGYTALEIINQSMECFYPSEDKAAGKPASMLQTASEEGRVEIEGWRMRKDGSRFWADVVITAVLDQKKQLFGYSEVSRDLTERKKADTDRLRYIKERAEGVIEQGRLTQAGSEQKEALGESEERYRLLVEGVKDYAIFMLDKEGKVLTWNDGAERAKGYKAEEIIGHSIESFYTKEDQDLHKPVSMLKTAAEQDRVAYEGWMMRKDGSRFWADVVITAVRDREKQLIGYSEVSRDLTERKAAEIENDRHIKELASSNVELQQFAYVASHDLQEPLRMITSYTQLLSKRYKGKLDADADEFISYATDGAGRMQRLIEDLLTYSRLGTNRVPFVQVDSNDILKRALNNLSVAIRESNAVVTTDPLPGVVVVESQFLQLFQNLVGNAIKYHGTTPPRVHVSVREKESEWIFSVRDTGIGIDPQYAERIFVIFQRLHTSETYAGTGIGLAVCKKIVERHGGRIWVESNPGQGAVFYFTIPIKGENKIGNTPRS